MLIAFTHQFKAFLPEIAVYRQFFEQYGIETIEVRPDQLSSLQPDVEWRFMGTQFKKGRAPVLIHEYASGSLPPWRKAKDFIKSRFTVKPEFRLFLNKYVQEQFSFSDNLPYGFRDMGINQQRIAGAPVEKTYDFIYVGSVSKDMQIEKLLDCFRQPGLKNKSLLMLCKNYGDLQNRYRDFSNIIFKGPVAQDEVSNYISQASFAINYKPAIAPHNHQTSTKMLEYAACGIPIITTDFAWVRGFQQQYGGKYFYLSNDLSNLDWEKIREFQYAFPDLSEWSWVKQIRNSGVLEFLKKKFGDLEF
jgi:glycosyltransferase involved in cell wall biosynthesis